MSSSTESLDQLKSDSSSTSADRDKSLLPTKPEGKTDSNEDKIYAGIILYLLPKVFRLNFLRYDPYVLFEESSFYLVVIDLGQNQLLSFDFKLTSCILGS